MTGIRVRRPSGGYARQFGQYLLVFSAVVAILAPVLETGSRNAVWFHAASIAALVWLERIASNRWPGRPLSFLRATLFIAAAQPVFLCIAFLLEGEARYANISGYFSHADKAWLVALASVLLHGAAVAGAFLAGRGIAVSQGIRVLHAGFSRWFFTLVAWLAIIHGLARLTVLFLSAEVPLEISYSLRIFLSNFLAIFAFLGMALRLRISSARVAGVFSLVVASVVLLSGSRGDALMPFLYVAVGFVLAEPVDRRTLGRWAAVAVPVFIAAMLFGSLVRQDERGRTGDAALARLGEVGTAAPEVSENASVSEHTIRRMVSNSYHSVITRIPQELPFEENGLLKIPEEFLAKFLPRFNYGGTSDTEVPRHWMLNDLGFLVNWATSVELPLAADAWYRGGFVGLVVVGLLLGFAFQLTENALYRAMQSRTQYSTLLLFGMTGLPLVEARDVVSALRGMVFLLVAGLAVVALARLLESRKGEGPRTGTAHREAAA